MPKSKQKVTPKQMANLKPRKTLTTEEAKKMGSAGGKKSVKVRQEKKVLAEVLETVMNLSADEKTKDMLVQMGLPDNECTYQTAIIATLTAQALKGNLKASELLLEYQLKIKEENRKDIESNVRVDAIRANQGGDMSLTSGEEGNNVVIYLPKLDEDEEDEPDKE